MKNSTEIETENVVLKKIHINLVNRHRVAAATAAVALFTPF